MSSVSSSAASRSVVTGASSLRAVGRNADDNSSGAAFAVKPAASAQDPESDTSPPADEVIFTADAMDAAAAHELPDPAAAYSAKVAAAQAAQTASPDSDAVSETILPAPAAYNGSPASQAAYAYAQTMQAWLHNKNPRPAAVSRPARPQADNER
jgi:hypothetical protein